MQKIRFLTAKESRELLDSVHEQWGAECHFLLGEFAMVRSSKDKIYLVSRGVQNIDLTVLRMDSLGMYFAEVRDNNLRLSIEGAQLVGPFATKNIVELTKEELTQWLKGEDVQKKGDWKEFVILKHGKDIVGSGKYSEGIIYNFVPKVRRVKELILSEKLK